jgi:hypothetical protein
MAPWKLPLIVAAIAVPIAVAFAVAGPGVGVAVGALAGVAVVVVAARQKPRRQISAAEPDGLGRHVLVVVTCLVEAPEEVAEILAAAGLGDGGDDAEVLVLAPARIGFLDRWASDVEGARRRAQENLVATVAALAKAGIAAEARVGDEDVVQAVEDQLGSYPASEVVLVGDGSAEGESADAAAEELAARLQPEFRRVVLGSVSG